MKRLNGKASLPQPMRELIQELSRLPSIGERSATRLAYYLLANSPDRGRELAQKLIKASESVTLCGECFFLSESPLCSLCSDARRDKTILCLVEKPMDLLAIERVGEFDGLYHVLHGLWAPLRGVRESDLKLKELINRVDTDKVKEVIIALSSTVEGDATTLLVAEELSKRGVLATRLAQGIPRGGDIEYVDDFTVSKALLDRAPLRPIS